MFLETKVKMKGKKGDEILAELRGVPTSDKQQGAGHWDLLPPFTACEGKTWSHACFQHLGNVEVICLVSDYVNMPLMWYFQTSNSMLMAIICPAVQTLD